MLKLLKWLRQETRRVLPAIIYFFIAFNLFRLTFGQMFIHVGIPRAPFATTIIWAIIVGKIMVIADNLPFLNIFSRRPLICNTVWRTSVYFVISFIFTLCEHLIPLIFKHQDIVMATHRLLEEIWWARFLTIQIWYLILLFVFVVAQELVKGVGAGKLRELFFGR